MSWYNHGGGDDVDFDKHIDVDVYFDYDADIYVDINKDVDIDVTVDVCVDVSGNFAEVVFDAEAIGEDTYVQADLTVISIEDTMSHASGVITAAVA